LARLECAPFYGLAKILPVFADVKLVVFDSAVIRRVLPGQGGETFDAARRIQFNDDFVGKPKTVAAPQGMPIGVGVAIHGFFSAVVRAIGFLAVHSYELELNSGEGSDFGWLNIMVIADGSKPAKQTAAQNEREAEEEFGVHGEPLLGARK